MCDYFAVKDLGEAVGGDEPEAADFRGAGEFCGALPPIHDEVGAVGHLVVDLAEGGDVAVAEFGADVFASDEGWVAYDEVGLPPIGFS
jgi:hypothetical protein